MLFLFVDALFYPQCFNHLREMLFAEQWQTPASSQRPEIIKKKSFCSGKIPCTYVPTISLQKNLTLESTVFPTHSKPDTPQRVKMFPYVFVFLIVIVFVFVRVFVSLMVSYKEMSSAPTRSLSKRDTSCCASPVAKGAPARDPEVQNILNWAIGNI